MDDVVRPQVQGVGRPRHRGVRYGVVVQARGEELLHPVAGHPAQQAGARQRPHVGAHQQRQRHRGPVVGVPALHVQAGGVPHRQHGGAADPAHLHQLCGPGVGSAGDDGDGVDEGVR
ncbi:hypothetical protein E4N62_46870 [Streptomyces sp. MNU76]|uniref:hypothetical protein n=1 Tax=Streptomyces sp. MNU76 TaxID=2560026 RepID=UPI001E2C99C4|nr:hypothetical protein [Streptomyces sp. MNU76]MCC9712081.1 hypothetical protein [Streptomyces sp. MNU76]